MAQLNVNFPTFLTFKPRGKDFEISVNMASIGLVAPFPDAPEEATQFFFIHDLDVSWVTDTPYPQIMKTLRNFPQSN